MKKPLSLFVAISTLLIASLNTAFAMSEGTARDAMVAAGEAAFQHRCMACHSLDSAKNAFGPSLRGVIDRPAGSLPRFAYSKAMLESGLVWSEENIRKWIADNEKLVPNTRMRHVSITDVTEQDFLIEFLKSLK
ncbi:c-type cytochrome [Sedimenticola hydrogenitrophicus]|uniref:c-type cytochrome n=1 Tax=Sedimenticola hydrogenitrophicus TaxID=2967975 RepID=UPI0023AFBD2C|nr:c-type cytochrome [Sedimenticola hydrogenitrophicus]